jgi:hypothetical protein
VKLALPLLLLPALALPGCGLGSDDATPDDDSDTRSVVMACLEEEGVDARLQGDREIVVGDGPGAPRIRFFLTAGESEAAQFKGRGEGTEQIGAAWLFVNEGSDDLLEEVENCLAEQ